jgi:hypothetical protein
VRYYKCSCGEVFKEYQALVRVEYDRSEFWGQVQTRAIECLLCPKCGESDMDDFQPCKAGCEEEAMEGDDYCVLCSEAIEEDHPSPEKIARAQERIADEVLELVVNIARTQV